MRATVDKIPYSKDLADLSKLPLGLVVQPLAKQKKEEVWIQVVNHGEEGPVRCNRCRAYINPWCTFTQGGSRFICNICSHVNEGKKYIYIPSIKVMQSIDWLYYSSFMVFCQYRHVRPTRGC